jgi:cation transport ATPase
MKIPVTCPTCLTRFEVDQKFAGKKGPCPKCKAVIQVPALESAVVIHSPEGDGPKDSKGQLVLKPITRQETKVTRKGIAIVVGLVAVAIIVAVAVRLSGIVVEAENFRSAAVLGISFLGIVLLAPPLVFAGYSFVRDQELEPYRGKELWVRIAIMTGVLAASWLVYAFLPAYLFEFDYAYNAPYWLFGVTMIAMFGIGTFAAVATFELESVNGFALSALYYLSVLGLALIAGIPLTGL